MAQAPPVAAASNCSITADREIYVLALRSGSVDVSDLARRFDVTTETIRRDLSDLQERQLLRHVHGGAVPFERLHHEPMVDARDMLNAEEKLRIGREAIHEVPEHGSVIVDSGSTGQRFAEVFPVDRRVHVVTNSFHRRDPGPYAASTRSLSSEVGCGGTRSRWWTASTVAAVRATGRRAVHQLRRTFVPTRPHHSLPRRECAETGDARATRRGSSSRWSISPSSATIKMLTYAALDEIDVLLTDTRADDDALLVLAEHDLEVRRA